MIRRRPFLRAGGGFSMRAGVNLGHVILGLVPRIQNLNERLLRDALKTASAACMDPRHKAEDDEQVEGTAPASSPPAFPVDSTTP
jgi:hypothetical protein